MTLAALSWREMSVGIFAVSALRKMKPVLSELRSRAEGKLISSRSVTRGTRVASNLRTPLPDYPSLILEPSTTWTILKSRLAMEAMVEPVMGGVHWAMTRLELSNNDMVSW